MVEVLIDVLCNEIDSLNNCGQENLEVLYQESDDFLQELKQLESKLEQDVELEENGGLQSQLDFNFDLKKIEKLDKRTNNWYKSSINHLKIYNSSINKFFKNILNNPKFNIDLDDAYTYPLNLNNHPCYDSQANIKNDNRIELIKSIIIHLLKGGQCDIVPELIKEILNCAIDENLLSEFHQLNLIVDDIIIKHDLKAALNWLELKYNESNSLSKNQNNHHVGLIKEAGSISGYKQIEFKLNMLQLILLLNTSGHFTSDDAYSAFLYSKDKFQKFFIDYLQEISTLMLLLVYRQENESEMKSVIKDLILKIKQGYEIDKNRTNKNKNEAQFITELLNNFDNIHDNQTIFINLANEFISEYCKHLHLSKDSSLFQSVLAGFVYLPSFYKYNRIQMKMNNIKSSQDDKPEIINHEATYHYDLPFQLPDSPRFLFRYHPIFICPVSKEQFIPMNNPKPDTKDDEQKVKRIRTSESETIHPNPVVVLNFCNHLALSESVYQLSKKGTDIFKCHYCYKKHKFSDVTNAYIIDY